MDRKELDKVRESLEDVHLTLSKLAPHCQDLDEVIALITLAIGDGDRPPNHGQLKILQAILTSPVQQGKR